MSDQQGMYLASPGHLNGVDALANLSFPDSISDEVGVLVDALRQQDLEVGKHLTASAVFPGSMHYSPMRTYSSGA